MIKGIVQNDREIFHPFFFDSLLVALPILAHCFILGKWNNDAVVGC